MKNLPTPQINTEDKNECWVKPDESAWRFWKSLLDEEEGEYFLPSWCAKQQMPGRVLEKTLNRVRQLGVKTVMLRSTDWPHTRLNHSIGCATLAWTWQRHIEKKDPAMQVPAYPPSVTTLAAALHDVGHLPFSHLAEQALSELHWTIGSEEAFHHDAEPLRVAWKQIADEARGLLKFALPAEPEPNRRERLVTDLIEGHSGVPYLNAILNGPIDADKIDYVFRDCQMLGQSIHLPVGQIEDDNRKTPERCKWFRTFIEYQSVLPSGLLAIYGLGGEKARELLEERWYLYRNVYNRPVFRGIERLARAILVLWLTRNLSKRIRADEGYIERPINTRAVAGEVARDALWEMLTQTDPDLPSSGRQPIRGEAAMVNAMASDLSGDTTLPAMAKEWVAACANCIDKLRLSDNRSRTLDELESELPKYATVGRPVFITKDDYDAKVREAIRNLEYDPPFVAMIDAAVMPPMLSYPKNGKNGRISEQYVVPHRDPDHWGRRPPGRWTPLSESAYAKWDRTRWVQLLVVSPFSQDFNGIGHVEDRLHTDCRHMGVKILGRMPLPGGGAPHATPK